MKKENKNTDDLMPEYDSLKKKHDQLQENLDKVEATKAKIVEDALKEYHSQKLEMLTQIDKIRRVMKILNPTEPPPYDKEEGYKEKIIWVLNEKQQIMPATPIAKKIGQMDNKHDDFLTGKKVRLAIDKMLEKDEIVKLKTEGLTGFHYGLPEWFVNGVPIQGYLA